VYVNDSGLLPGPYDERLGALKPEEGLILNTSYVLGLKSLLFVLVILVIA
jgi:hypothetical protein